MKIKHLLSNIGPVLPILVFTILLFASVAIGQISLIIGDETGLISNNFAWLESKLISGLAIFCLVVSTLVSVYLNIQRVKELKAFEVGRTQLQAVFDNTPVCLNLKDREGRYLLVNKPYEKWLDYTAADILGKKASEFLTNETEVENLSAAEKIVLETGQVFEREVSVERPDGKTYHRILIKYPIRKVDGSIEAVGTVAVDVTERKEIEYKLKELNEKLESRIQSGIDEMHASEDRFRHAFENAPIGVALITPDGNRFQVNQALADFLGLTVDELTDTSMLSTAGNDADLNKSMALRQKVLDGEIDTYSNERRYRHKDGHIIWGEVTASLYRNSAGVPEHFIAHTVDITERKKVEEALWDSESRFRSFIDNTPSAVLLKNTSGQYIQANKTWHDWFNPDGVDITGKTVFDFYAREHAEEVAALDYEVLNSGKFVQTETRTPYADGKTRTTLFQKFPIRDQAGEIVAIGGINTDITPRKELEEKLIQAQKMEAVGQLTGGIAHDFNNLLAVILGNAELIVQEAESNDPKTEAVIRAATRGAELTSQLLAFSRKQTLQPQLVDIDKLVDNMKNLLDRALGETIEIVISSTDDLWRTNIDPGQLENALLNLTINARHAMPKGGKLVIDATNSSIGDNYHANDPNIPAKDFVVIAITDNGCGMSPEILEHAFEPFFTTKDVGEGSGLGLAMVYGFTKQSGGQATIESAPGRGTTVRLYLPRMNNKSAASDRKMTAETPGGRGENILIVEDDPEVRELAAMLLEDIGYNLAQAGDGIAALAAIENGFEADLLLSDIVLPNNVNGLELANDIKSRVPAIKVLFMSGYAESAVQQHGLAGRDIELLNKPFRRQEIAQTVRRVLDR